MRIGELARLTGTAVDTIRHYEREGLAQPGAELPAKSHVGHSHG